MTVLSSVLAAAFLLVFVGTIVGAALTERPLASCSWCGERFDSVPAFTAHVMECDRGASW